MLGCPDESPSPSPQPAPRRDVAAVHWGEILLCSQNQGSRKLLTDQTCPNISILGHTEYSQPVLSCLVQIIALQTLTWDHLMDTAKEEVCYQGEEGGVEPVDRRQIGQQREGHPWKTQGKWAGHPGLCSWHQPPALLTLTSSPRRCCGQHKLLLSGQERPKRAGKGTAEKYRDNQVGGRA